MNKSGHYCLVLMMNNQQIRQICKQYSCQRCNLLNQTNQQSPDIVKDQQTKISRWPIPPNDQQKNIFNIMHNYRQNSMDNGSSSNDSGTQYKSIILQNRRYQQINDANQKNWSKVIFRLITNQQFMDMQSMIPFTKHNKILEICSFFQALVIVLRVFSDQLQQLKSGIKKQICALKQYGTLPKTIAKLQFLNQISKKDLNQNLQQFLVNLENRGNRRPATKGRKCVDDIYSAEAKLREVIRQTK